MTTPKQNHSYSFDKNGEIKIRQHDMRRGPKVAKSSEVKPNPTKPAK
jgi:hypothetical protein